MNKRQINISTNWEDSVRMMLELLPHMNPEGVKEAHRHIIHAAKIADAHVQITKAEGGQHDHQ
tara:strand:+ start:79 stop:267 length:189 start_codon:yes stop_codon:yes gene_type:complete